MENLAKFQEANCKGCKFAERKLVGTGKPCCTYWTSIQVEGKKCLTRKPEKS